VARARAGDTQERRREAGAAEDPQPEEKAARPARRKAVDAPTLDLAPPVTQGRNLELKFRHAALDEVKRRAGTLGGVLHARLSQEDQVFATEDGARLKLRREVQHLPDGQARHRAELVRYVRENAAAARVSVYEREPVADPDTRLAELAARHGLDATVRKGREVVLIGRTRLHLDAVAGLGTFVELELVLRDGETPEAARAELEHIIRGLGLYGLSPEPRAYADLLREKLTQA